MEIIYENKSLRFICNALNVGLVEYENLESVQIVSKNKPEFVVKLLDVDITNYAFNLTSKSLLKDKIDQCETNFYDYVVFGTVLNPDDNIKTLMTISLFELILTSPKISDDSNPKSSWDLETEEWSLILV
jgi:hypothetical protein